MTRLTAAQQAVLDALWQVPGSGRALAEDVQRQAARMGNWRALPTIIRTLDQLVELGCAARIMIRGVDGAQRAYFFPTRRAGETMPR